MTANAEADRAFLDFHGANPQVYTSFVEYAREMKYAMIRRGEKPVIGAKAVWERLRWQVVLTTTDDDFKLNNNHVSRYARLAMQREPDLAGMFNTRRLKVAPGELALRS